MIENWKVVRAVPEDAEQLGELIYKSYSELMKSHYDSSLLDRALPLITQANMQLINSGKFYVMVSNNGKFLACGGWSVEAPEGGYSTGGVGHLRHFATLPEYLRKGMARAIYNVCHDEAVEMGIGVFECFSSVNAEDFYRSVGFATIETKAIPLPGNVAFPCIHMKKRVK